MVNIFELIFGTDGEWIMNIKFINASKSTIKIMINSEIISVFPNSYQNIVSDLEAINVGFCLDGKSFLNKLKSFEFQLLSSYVINSKSNEAVVYMNAYKKGGDNWEN